MANWMKWSTFFILILLSSISSADRCKDDSLYLIRSAASNLVLDGGNSNVTIQYFDGYKPQLWKFKRGNLPGLFVIMNNSTGTVLDIEVVNVKLIRVVLAKPQPNVLNQQWHIHKDSNIINAGLNKNLDILNAKYVPGNPLIVNADNGNTAQDFVIKERDACGP